MRVIILTLIFLSLLILSSGAKAQFIWNMAHTDAVVNSDLMIDTMFSFTSVSCAGNNCCASAILNFLSSHARPQIAMYRSNNGGISWHQQVLDIALPPDIINDGMIKIQQIDSLNEVAVGGTGVVIRTSDAGQTWGKQNFPEVSNFTSVHFYDSKTGTITVYGDIYFTKDGGLNWENSGYPGGYHIQSHAYGNGKFRFFKYGSGKIFTTYNNFKTIDSTTQIFDSIFYPNWYRYLLTGCSFSNGDTILAYGVYRPNDTVGAFETNGLIIRSVDAGIHWEKPFVFPSEILSQVNVTTSINQDTIYGGGLSNNYFLISTDMGASWKADSIQIDTSYTPYACVDLSLTDNSHPIAIFSSVPFTARSILARGEVHTSHVEAIERIKYYTYIYPNPSSGFVKIESIDKSGAPIRITDIFGRNVMDGKLSDQGKLTLDLSRLPKGIYDVLLDHFGRVFSVGKVVLIGK